ncbi:MAG TPA: hypothetical protein VGE91_08810 [Solirubrobacterales bacterium]
MTRQELLAAGVSGKEIRHRLEIGALISEYDGVYRVGHRARSVEARYTAAVKAGGHGATLSGLPAAHWLRFIKGRPPAPEVTSTRRCRVEGLSARQSRRPVEAMIWRGIPVTTPARTLVDIAKDLPEEELAQACHEAGVRFKTTPRQVNLLLARRSNAPGAATLRRITSGDSPVLLSQMERRFRKLLREAGLPLPQFNRPRDGHYVDCRWPDHKLTVELDSYRFHNSRHAFEDGYRRQRKARARGDEFRAYCWGDVFETPAATVEEVRKALGRVEA